MTIEREPRSGARHSPGAEEAAERLRAPRTWLLSLVFLILIVGPVLILVFSNTDSTELRWASWGLTAPLWIVLGVTFLAGAIGTRLFGWVWGALRRRSKKRRAEYDRARREAANG